MLILQWGCSNRISNGRAACDSHHVNEDTLQNTYTAAIRDMIEDAEEIMAAVKESAGLVMEPENRAALDRIEQEIIDLQNSVLELHKAKQQRRSKSTVRGCRSWKRSRQNCRPQKQIW